MSRYYLQIKFKGTKDPFFLSSWDINEPFDNFNECDIMAIELMDNTIAKMRIVDIISNKICKQFIIR